MFENAEVVLKGTWLYDGCITCHIRIIKWHTLYGSGDYEDPPEISDDKEIECYYVIFESIIDKGKIASSRGGFLTLSEAITEAEEVTYQKINWAEPNID
ncbi:hypothetical protein FDF26_06230 [Clostridium botulinum]|nr:hypothetical protein [Clostridium botulinum]